MKKVLGLLTLLVAFDASANNLFIPNYYKNRREVNQYSAIGWSARKEAGLLFTQSTSEEDVGGTKDNETDQTEIFGHVYNRFDQGVNLEFQIANQSQEQDNLSPVSTDDLDGRVLLLNMGYEFQEQPLAIGVTFYTYDIDGKDGSTGIEFDWGIKTIAAGIGYKLDSDMYLGFGMTNAEWDLSSNNDLSVQTYSFGFGKVYGDAKNPTASTEAVLTLANELGVKSYALDIVGLYNVEAFQYYGGVGYTISNGNTDSQDDGGYNVKLGLDYQFSDFYVGPQLEYSRVSSKDDSVNTDTDLSLQVGYRVTNLEVYARYNAVTDDEDQVINTSDTKEDTNQISLSAIYKF